MSSVNPTKLQQNIEDATKERNNSQKKYDNLKKKGSKKDKDKASLKRSFA